MYVPLWIGCNVEWSVCCVVAEQHESNVFSPSLMMACRIGESWVFCHCTGQDPATGGSLAPEGREGCNAPTTPAFYAFSKLYSFRSLVQEQTFVMPH